MAGPESAACLLGCTLPLPSTPRTLTPLDVCMNADLTASQPVTRRAAQRPHRPASSMPMAEVVPAVASRGQAVLLWLILVARSRHLWSGRVWPSWPGSARHGSTPGWRWFSTRYPVTA